MKPRTYEILRRAVEEGVRYGLSRARKHVESPSDAQIESAVEEAVMNEICEYFTFDEAER